MTSIVIIVGLYLWAGMTTLIAMELFEELHEGVQGMQETLAEMGTGLAKPTPRRTKIRGNRPAQCALVALWPLVLPTWMQARGND